MKLYNYIFFLFYKSARNKSIPHPEYHACIVMSVPFLFFGIIFLKLLWIYELFFIEHDGLRFIYFTSMAGVLCFFILNWLVFIKNESFKKLITQYKKKDEVSVKLNTFFMYMVVVVLAVIAMYLPINVLK